MAGHWPLATGRDISGVSFSSKTKGRKERKHRNVNGKMIKKQVTQLKMVDTRGREGIPSSQGKGEPCKIMHRKKAK
ncbi:hypothetical protein I7I50_00352 [Histoplasma capsulatum G186AR]|uniref:Uncharacterized protein n=1 Tax=Ajellomyces capsulatus TaxID=5037 RepID=A0A8H7YIV1_AJECA|nr:hypothetical protein I7I52_07620 [Histoplasma capsulatum]QSS72490.1 hypothetical protein I7I50_00352 [Histoplasma capsulatum G186AR]